MVEFNFSEDKVEEAQPELKLELNEDSEEEIIIEDEEPIKIQEKEKPNENDIFEDIMPKQEKVVEKPVKVKKPRKPMSEEHKKKLALAREKAMAVRKAKAEEKKKMKALDNEEKELLKKQKFKKVKKLKEEVESDSVPQESKTSYPTSTITKKDLEEAQLDAIMKYEAIRKERKAKKKEEAMIEAGKMKMLNQINRATGNTYRYRDGSNKFDNCY